VQAVILAAGEGTRMRPLTYTKPKVMLPIMNKPIMEHLIIELRKAGIKDIVCVVGYRDDRIREHFGDGENWKVRMSYVTQRKQLGTADALKSSSHLLEDEFILVNGDTIVDSKDIKRVSSSNRMTLGVIKVQNPEDFGVVELRNGNVVKIIEKPEKPPSNLVNAGIYHFYKEILKTIDRTPKSIRGEYEITDTIQMLINNGYEFGATEISTWIDVGYPWDLLNANEQILSKVKKSEIDGEIEDGAVIKGSVVVKEGTIVRSGSYITGPTIIGKNCDIGPNCLIRPYTAIGDRCRVGNGVEIKNSIIMSNTKIPHLNYVGDSVIGENCNLGAGTNIANLRLDKKEISVSVKGKSHHKCRNDDR
jgi:bifunctional UDP-N-acetylglucosamine pyrophosphorylase/glucosamine-1-phosphate N-acetyltransferase